MRIREKNLKQGSSKAELSIEEREKGSTSAVDQTGIDPSLAKALIAAKMAIDKKAENVKVLDLSGISGFTDYFVISSGTSDRQVQAIADSVKHALGDEGVRPLATEGYAEGRWVLMDFGDIVVHIFLDALREYYDLETLWSEAQRVRLPSEFYAPGGSVLN